MRSLSTLAALLLGLAVVFWAPAAKADCPHKDNFDHRHCPGDGGTTLGDLECSTDQIAKYDGTNWVCDLDRGVKFVFASSTTSDGDLGGLDGADTECNVLAENAGLPGEFVAWLSTSSVDAVVRLAGSDGPWFNTNGVMVAASLTDLTQGTIHGTITYAEDGLAIQGRAWTGTLPDGTGGGEYCEDWTSGLAEDSGIRGDLQITSDGRWTDEDIVICNSSLSHTYCFEK